MNLCSQRSRSVRITPPHPSPGRGSFITAPCNKKARKSSLHQKKNGRRENRVRGFSCRVFGFANPLKQPKESNWHFVSQPQKKFKTSAAELGSKSKSLKIFPKISFSLLQKIKIFNLNLSGIPISAQGSPQGGLPYHQLVPSVPLTGGGWWPVTPPQPGTSKVVSNQQNNSMPYQSDWLLGIPSEPISVNPFFF